MCVKKYICWLHNNSFFLFFLLFCVELIFIETASYPGSPYLGDFHHGQQWGIECDIWRGMFFVSGRSCLCVCSFRPLCIIQPLICVGFVCQYVWHVYMTCLLNWMSTATVVALFLLIKFYVWLAPCTSNNNNSCVPLFLAHFWATGNLKYMQAPHFIFDHSKCKKTKNNNNSIGHLNLNLSQLTL